MKLVWVPNNDGLESYCEKDSVVWVNWLIDIVPCKFRQPAVNMEFILFFTPGTEFLRKIAHSMNLGIQQKEKVSKPMPD